MEWLINRFLVIGLSLAGNRLERKDKVAFAGIHHPYTAGALRTGEFPESCVYVNWKVPEHSVCVS